MKRFLRLTAVIDRTGLSKTAIYAGIKAGVFPGSVPIDPLGSSMTVAWIEEEINAWMEERIRRARGETIATAIEQADGLLSGLGATNASIPTVSEPPIQPIKKKTRNPSYKHHLHLDRIRPENYTRSPKEHHFNELERIRRENEMAEAE